MDYKYHKYRRIRHWVVAPFLWVNIIPLLLLDLFLEIYHRIAFRIYLLPFYYLGHIPSQMFKEKNWITVSIRLADAKT
ncbi:hypothetical protein KY313_03295 [Candidatus Woesearchaeota archaeon]|nr:hypothetical protein [Candidatus Woesearchaeota archaeon]